MRFLEIQIFWEPFPHLKCKNGSECGIGMDCPVMAGPLRPYPPPPTELNGSRIFFIFFQ